MKILLRHDAEPPKSNICKSEQSWFGVVFRENHLKCDNSHDNQPVHSCVSMTIVMTTRVRANSLDVVVHMYTSMWMCVCACVCV